MAAAAQGNPNVYEFKIILKGPKPLVWRRIQVPGDYTFYNLHLAIQNSMGWWNYHLHKFEMINPKTGHENIIGDPKDYGSDYVSDSLDKDDDSDVPDFLKRFLKFTRYANEKKAKIADYFLAPKDKAVYEYDFGFSWEHDIVLEKIFPKVDGVSYPQCVAGKRACPPEDGNDDNLPEDHDPEEFDPKKVDFTNKGMLG